MPTLGLSMIVKNGAETLHACLASVRGLVDVMAIGDTGSTDRTIEIARSFGATVLHVPWTNDFAAARNTVIAALETEWVLTLDADEELPPEAHAWIREAIQAPETAAYLVPVRNYLSPYLPPPSDQVMLPPGQRHPRAPDAVAYFPSACCRLFRHGKGLVYSGRVHEMVDYNLPALGARVQAAGFLIHHFGWYLADAAKTAAKRTLYRELLAKKMEEMPDDPNTLVRYATLLSEDCGDPEQALVHARRAAELDGNAPGAWLFTGMILRRLGRFREALDALSRVPVGDQPSFHAMLLGDTLYGLERLGEARNAYGIAVALAPLDRLAAAKLGLLEVRTGAVSAGLARIRAAAEGQPRLSAVEELLVCALLAAGEPAQAAREAEVSARRSATAEAWLTMARLHAQAADWHTALYLLELGIAEFPEAEQLHGFRINAGVAVGSLSQAAQAAERVVALAPTPRSFLRLAAVLSHSGNPMRAAEVLQRGLELFPGSNMLTGAVSGTENAPHAATC